MHAAWGSVYLKCNETWGICVGQEESESISVELQRWPFCWHCVLLINETIKNRLLKTQTQSSSFPKNVNFTNNLSLVDYCKLNNVCTVCMYADKQDWCTFLNEFKLIKSCILLNDSTLILSCAALWLPWPAPTLRALARSVKTPTAGHHSNTSKGCTATDKRVGLCGASAPCVLYPTVAKWRGLVRWILEAGPDVGGATWDSNRLIFCATAADRLFPSTGLWEEKRSPSSTAGRQSASSILDLWNTEGAKNTIMKRWSECLECGWVARHTRSLMLSSRFTVARKLWDVSTITLKKKAVSCQNVCTQTFPG